MSPIGRVHHPRTGRSGEKFSPPEVIRQRDVANRSNYFTSIRFQHPADGPVPVAPPVDGIILPEGNPLIIRLRLKTIANLKSCNLSMIPKPCFTDLLDSFVAAIVADHFWSTYQCWLGHLDACR